MTLRAWRTSTASRGRIAWTLLVGVLIVVIVAGIPTRRYWLSWIASAMVCAGRSVPSDLILVENFDVNYLVFERAGRLQQMGLAPRILVPVKALEGVGAANPVSKSIAEVMARHARFGDWRLLPVVQREPISLNAALEVRDYLLRERVRSMIVVSPGFRSRRSSLVYGAVLAHAGTIVHCEPVFDDKTPATWSRTWHGVQRVTEELLKFAYYRLYVLPKFRSRE